MAYGVSFNIGRGVRIYRSGGGGAAFAFALAAVYAYLWTFVAFMFLVALTTALLLIVGSAIGDHFTTKRRVSELRARAVSPLSIAVAGQRAGPRTFGVYCVEGFSAGKRALQYRVGNHPVRQKELAREFGAAGLLMLFATRADAEEFKHLLAAGRVSPAPFLAG